MGKEALYLSLLFDNRNLALQSLTDLGTLLSFGKYQDEHSVPATMRLDKTAFRYFRLP